MTLREKFAKATNKGIYYVITIIEDAEIIEQIVDEFAIEFAEWCDDNYFRMGGDSIWSDSTDWENNIKITTKELLEIYKREKRI
jgi:hypothetical protein